MSKIAIVYWSGTGNTEAMANSVLAGAQAAGAQAELFTAAEFGPEKLAEYDAAAFGCPAMFPRRTRPGNKKERVSPLFFVFHRSSQFLMRRK